MDAHGRAGAAVADAVDVRGGEAERAAGAAAPGRGRAAEQQAVLDHLALRDGHGAGGAVVVVEAGVVVVHPADEPDGEVVVADELLVDALGRVVADERAPEVGPSGEPGDDVLELGALEVAPELAHDTEATLREARRLWELLGRQNVMIKIPGTPEGVPAIEQATAEGINVNVTLLFSVEAYEAIAEAYIRGMERRLEEGRPLDVQSVASFFVSRVDSKVDKLLEKGGHTDLMGEAGIWNARAAYVRFKEIFEGDRFAELREAGAPVQRPLWASTGVKNPKYPDTLYVDTLIGPDTVNTMPEATLEAFEDHGTLARTVDADLDAAARTLDRIREVGVDLDDVSRVLEDQGVAAFAKSFDELIASLSAKADRLR